MNEDDICGELMAIFPHHRRDFVRETFINIRDQNLLQNGTLNNRLMEECIDFLLLANADNNNNQTTGKKEVKTMLSY